MKNVHAHTETGTVSSYPGYISINERTPTENGRPFEVSVREDTGGGFKPAFARIWLSRGELIKLAKDIGAYLNPHLDSDTPTATAQPQLSDEEINKDIAAAFGSDLQGACKAQDVIHRILSRQSGDAADKEGKVEQHSDDMNDAVLRGIVLASQGEAGDMLSEMDVLKDEQQAEPALCAWLERAARSGIAEVEHAARTMMAFYQGAEFPEPPAQQLSEEEICKAVAEITKPPKSRKYQTLCDDVPADQVYDFAIDLVRALLAKGK